MFCLLICLTLDPTAGQALVAGFNLPGVSDGELVLTGEILALIYAGQITMWNHSAITALNPGLHQAGLLPGEPILLGAWSDENIDLTYVRCSLTSFSKKERRQKE